jgi:enterochelin esterase-like enzyme
MVAVQNKHLITFVPPDRAAFIIGDFTDWKQAPLPISGPLTLEFPAGVYIEYAFLDANRMPLTDPNNHQVPVNPWHLYDRYIALPQNSFSPPPRSQPLHGMLTTHTITSQIWGNERTPFVYEPPVFPTTTLYVQDGCGFCEGLKIHEVADNLIVQGRIAPFRLVMTEPLNHHSEYWFNEKHEAFLLCEIIPEVDLRYGATQERATWGASLGGLTAIWLAWKHPDLFTRIGSQSGCFKANPRSEGNEYTDTEWFTEQFAQTDRLPLRFYIQTGQIEWLLAANRRFAAVLTDKGYTHKYEEFPSGHAWVTWEQGLVPGLEYLFGIDHE